MWKTRMELILERTNLKGIVDGSSVMPTRAGDDQQIWKSKDLDARMEIIMHLSDEQVDHVSSLKTAYEMWDHLRKLHQPSDGTTKIFSYRTLMNLQMHEGEDLDTFLSNWKKHLDAAITAGNIIEEISRCEILMGALPASWMAFVSIHSEDKALNLQNLIAKLKQDELRRKRANPQHEVHHTAMVASIRNQRGSGFSPKSQMQKFQPKNKPSGSGAISISTIICRYCNKQGHFERDCRKKRFEQKGKWKARSHLQAHNALLQAGPSTHYDEDDDGDDFIQAFMCDVSGGFSKASKEALWFFDTGATHHLTNNKAHLHNYHPLSQALEVRFGDNGMKEAIGKGEVHLSMTKTKLIKIPNVYYVPGLIRNLLSVSEATANGTIIEFHHNLAIIYYKTQMGEVLKVMCPKVGRLYPLKMMDQTPIQALISSGFSHSNSTLLWHYRLGHLNPKSMKTCQIHKLLEGIPNKPFKYISVCEGCIFGKQSRQKFPSNNHKKTERPLQLIHSDLCGPMQSLSLDGNKYLISFIDDYTRFTILYFLREKSGAFNAFTTYKAYVENHHQSKISTIRTDNGGEYFSGEWIKFCNTHGIRHEHTVPYNPQQNGVAERKNRTLLDASRSMLQVARLHNRFWQEAVGTACYLQNRSPHKILGLNTPYTLWYGHKPHIGHVRVFGSIAYSHIPKEKRKKLDSHARKCIFMGYGEASGIKAYKLFDLDARKFFFSRSVTFDECPLMEKRHEVHQSTPNLKTNELIITGDSQIDNYGGPTTRGRSFKHLQLDHQQHESTPEKDTDNTSVTYYFNEIPTDRYIPHTSEVNIKDGRGKSVVNSHIMPSSNNGNISKDEGDHNGVDHDNNNYNTNIDACSTQEILYQPCYWSPKTPTSPNEDIEPNGTLENTSRVNEIPPSISLESKKLPTDSPNHSSVNRNLPSINKLKASRLLKTSKQKYRSIKDILADTEPFEALMVDFGEEEDSVSIQPRGEDNHSMPGDDVTLTSHEALNSEFKQEWYQAMKEELGSLMKNNTWELVPRPQKRKVVSCKWVLRVKSDSSGKPIRFKARVVARGFTQIPGIDFKETFAPTLRTTPMRLVWGITAALNLELHHLDVETAFLHGDLEEEIYMEQPPHFKDVEHPNFVCKLKKAIYGLKQSPRMWHTKLHSYLVKIKFKRLSSEPNLYIRKDGQSFIILGVYVDDLPIASNSIEALRHATHQLQQAFPVKDLGPMEYCLGIKVTRNRTEGTL